MKERILLPSIGLLIVLSAFWWGRSLIQSTPPGLQPVVAPDNRDGKPSRPAVGESKEELDRKRAEFMNIPIVFYGRVVDQDSKPIRNAVVSSQVDRARNLLEQHAGSNPTTMCDDAFTDGAGLFTISGPKGYVLSIISIRKEGYRSALHNATFSYDRRLPNPHQPDPSAPMEFVLIREDLPMAEKVFDRTLGFAWNTGPIMIEPGQEIGTLALNPSRSGINPANRRQQFDWKVDVSANGFGMTRVSGPWPETAPAGGYISRIVYDYPKAASDWVSGVDHKYAIKTANGKYGLLELCIYADHQDNRVCASVTIYLNKSGALNIDHR